MPNNGYSEESFERRRQWDTEILRFFTRAKVSTSYLLLRDGFPSSDVLYVKERGRHVVWIGDLNIAHTAYDVTHPR